MTAELPPPGQSSGSPRVHANPEFWRRIAFTVLFGIACYVVLHFIFLLSFVNAVYALVAQKRSSDLENLSGNLTRYLSDAAAYVAWASDHRPWPFQSSTTDFAQSPKF